MAKDALLDFRDYPEIYSSGIAEVHRLNGDVHFVYFRWRKFEGLWRRVVCGTHTMSIDASLTALPMIASVLQDLPLLQ